MAFLFSAVVKSHACFDANHYDFKYDSDMVVVSRKA